MSVPKEFVIIDESGHPRNADSHFSRPISAEILRQIKFSDNGAFVTEIAGQEAFVEAFDEPLIAEEITAYKKSPLWTLKLPFGVEKQFSLTKLKSDEWDRFHGLTEEGIPFVLSKDAQDQLFDSVDEFTDDSVSLAGKEYPVAEWLQGSPEVEKEKFWSELYKKQEARWDLGEASPILKDLLPRLKIPKARILVLGCGPGHDAAYFAEQGHVVTAVDMSTEALNLAKSKYSHLKNITWHEADIFKLPNEWEGQFDVIFEHTCYCAINPKLRNALVRIWLRLLAPQGHLMGVFFTMEKPSGPPFGGSEWEIRQRLKKQFHFVFWGRWRQSVERRQGLELAVYAQKK